MNLDLHDCTFSGPALPESFVRFELSGQLTRLGLLAGLQGKEFEGEWCALRQRFRSTGGPQSICHYLIAPLAECLGLGHPARQEDVATRDGIEDGGWLMQATSGARLRAWSFAYGTDLDAPHSTGRAYRFSPIRSAQRVLLVSGERLGLLTNGDELRLLLCDPARLDSHIAIPLAGWRARDLAPDSYRLLRAIATPKGLAALPEVLDAARMIQTRVTKDLRLQARNAIEGFLQAVLDHPANAAERHLPLRATTLWEEGLILVYRLLFILKLESTTDAAGAFSFASTSLWRNALSPNRSLGPVVRRVLDHGHDTGRMLEDGLRCVFRIFRDGLTCSELSVTALGGALFGAQATPLLDRLAWGERAIALLLDRLLWTNPKGRARERVHYGALSVEDLGRIYEALLELEPGITVSPMSRLRRAKLEVVVPAANAERCRSTASSGAATRVTWVEDIPAGRFYLRAGTGRKATGSYYTPHAFVRFLVRETLAPEIAKRSPDTDPNPGAILALKVVDPATGSGHFLVEACRYLADALYTACRLCDESAAAVEAEAARMSPDDSVHLLQRAAMLRGRVKELPNSDSLLMAYLPSRAAEGGSSGVSQSRRARDLPAPGRCALPVWGGQQSACGRIGKTIAVARVLCRRVALDLSRSSADARGFNRGAILCHVANRANRGQRVGSAAGAGSVCATR